MKTLPAVDMEARVTRLEEQMGMQVLAPAPEVGPAPDPVTGSAASDDAESVQPDGKLGVTSEEQVPERPRAPPMLSRELARTVLLERKTRLQSQGQARSGSSSARIERRKQMALLVRSCAICEAAQATA